MTLFIGCDTTSKIGTKASALKIVAQNCICKDQLRNKLLLLPEVITCRFEQTPANHGGKFYDFFSHSVQNYVLS